MKIKYLPPSPNATVDFGYGEIGVNHVKNSDAGPLISAGFARHIPYRNYVERLAAEATSQTAGSFQNVSVDGVEWGFDGSLSQFRVPVIIKKEGSTTTIFCGPVAGTPAPIVKQFFEATNQPVNNAEGALEAAQNRQALQAEADKTATYKYLRS